MNIGKTISMSALGLVLLGGSALGISRISPAPVHAQTAMPKEAQAVSQKEGAELKEAVERAEPANEQAQDKNLPGGGHQDQGQADHQFEGVE